MNLQRILFSLLFLLLSSTLSAQTFEWVRQFGGLSWQTPAAITTDVSGNVYTVGSFYGTVDFDPGAGVFNLTTFGTINSEVFISKLDAGGNFIWAKKLTAMDTTNLSQLVVNDIVLDDIGNIYLTGNFNHVVDFDPSAGVFNLTSVGYSDAYLLHLDLNGNFIDVKQLGGNGAYVGGNKLVVDDLDNVYLSGRFQATADFDPSSNTANLSSMTSGYVDIFLLKLDFAGNFMWVKQFGGTSSEVASDIFIDDANNIYLSGYFTQTIDFDPNAGVFNLTSLGLSDIFVVKLNVSGNLIWAKQIAAGTYPSSSTACQVDNWGNIYVIGDFEETADFDPSPDSLILSATSGNNYICKLNAAGNLVWVKQLTGASAIDLVVDDAGSLYVCGGFYQTVDFNPGAGVFNMSSLGNSDIFFYKLDSVGSFIWAKHIGAQYDDVALALTLDIASNLYTCGYFDGTGDFDTGSGVLQLTSQGRDAFIHKIGQCGIINPSVVYNNGNLTATSGINATYQWLNCSTNTTISGANAQVFSPTANGNYSVIVTQGTCSDTSNCITLTNVGVEPQIANSQVKLYPNPAQNEIHLSFSQKLAKNTLFNLRDLQGRVVFTQTLREGSEDFVLEMGDLAKGMYFWEVREEGKLLQAGKLVRE